VRNLWKFRGTLLQASKSPLLKPRSSTCSQSQDGNHDSCRHAKCLQHYSPSFTAVNKMQYSSAHSSALVPSQILWCLLRSQSTASGLNFWRLIWSTRKLKSSCAVTKRATGEAPESGTVLGRPLSNNPKSYEQFDCADR